MRRASKLLVAAAGILGLAGAARGETLGDAIALAYQTNPLLLADRADLRALNERYVQARAALGPQAAVSAQDNYDNTALTTPRIPATTIPRSPAVPEHTTNYGWVNGYGFRVSISQPIYTGGELALAVTAARTDILAGRQNLREQEANVLNEVISAYADALLYRALIVIAQQDIEILRGQSAEIEAKFAVKEVTRTDRAQTAARLIAAEIGLTRARANLSDAEARYVAVVGQSPGDLAPLPDLPGVPARVDEAFEAADHFNPSVLGAQYTEMASRARIAEAKAADGLQVSVGASYSREPYTPYLKDQRVNTYEATVTVNKPLFTAGAHASRVRQALETNNRDVLKVADTRRQIVRNVARAWNDLSERRVVVGQLREQLREEEQAFRGYKIEDRIGLRSTIDVLNAEQEYQATKVSLFQTYHDEFLTRAALLGAMGLLEVQVIAPDLPAYRPETAFKRVAASPTLPWVGLVQALDEIGSPRPALMASGRVPVGADLPPTADPAAKAPQWSDLAPLLALPSFE